MCLLYPEIFARKHLHGGNKIWYESHKDSKLGDIKNLLDELP